MAISSTGIGSGLDVEGLVTQLMAAERQPTLNRLAQQESIIQAKLSAYGTLKGGIATLQSAAGDIKNPETFSKRKVDNSDSGAVGVTVTNNAPPGSFSFAVTELAQSHSLASQSIASQSDPMGTGTLTIRFGTTDYVAATDTYNSFSVNPDSASVSVTIDSSNNSLTGIRDAINAATDDVSAAIVNDGSGYRLLLTSTTTGQENSLEISVDDDDENDANLSGLSQFAFNASVSHFDQTVAATDASFTVNGLEVTSASNSVSSVIDGMSLDLKQVTTDPVVVTVKRDTDAIKSAVTKFVDGYRAFNNIVNQLGQFDEASQSGSILLGDSTLRTVSSRIRQMVTGVISGASTSFSTLSEIGITSDEYGNLNIDDAKLSAAIDDNMDELAGFFSVFGQLTDSEIDYGGASADTQTGEYDITVSQLATQGAFVASGVLPDFGGGGTLTIDDTNDELTFEINGLSGTSISLAQGVYSSGQDLADELQSKINGETTFKDAGVTVSVTYDAVADALTITSGSYGSESSVNVLAVDTSTATSLGFSVTNGTDGLDIAGTIDGLAASGSGQTLTGLSGDAEGLIITVTGGSTGSRGTVNFSRGLGDQLDTMINQLLATDGLVDAKTKGLTSSIDIIEKDREAHEFRMEKVEARYRSQFGALDALVASLQSTGSFLTSALASVPKPPSSSS